MGVGSQPSGAHSFSPCLLSTSYLPGSAHTLCAGKEPANRVHPALMELTVYWGKQT